MLNPESVLERDTHTYPGILKYKQSPYLGQTNGPYDNQQQQKRELVELWSLLFRLTTQ